MADRYVVQGKIARGGIGAIYRAHDTVMGRPVAIKRLLPIEETQLNESQEGSLKREAAALARFQHPNVVTIYAFEEDADGPYVVMELVDGETLKETVERAALPVDDFVELAEQVLDPLVAARELNLLHRDIKPANIMLTWLSSGRFQVKVLDFGLAKFSQQPSLQTLDQTGSFLGSIDYLAPEQLELHPLDQRTDLYSLGCVLYFCLAQRPPFEGDNAAKTMQNHLSHRVTHLSEIRPDLPARIAEWVMRLIARLPVDRPADALAALRELSAAKRNEPLPAPVEAPAEEEDETASAEAPKKAAVVVARKGAGSAPVKARTQPQLVVPPSAREGSTPVRRKNDTTASKPVEPPIAGLAAWLRQHPMAAGFSAFAGVGLLFVAFSGGQSRNDDPAGAATDPAKGGGSPTQPGKAAPTPPKPAPPPTNRGPEPPVPDLKNQAIAQRKAAAPAVTGGLVAHYAASDAAYGEDFKTPAAAGQQVYAWGNLAAGAAPDHLLAVEKGQLLRGPTLEMVAPAEVPELKAPVPMLRFDKASKFATFGRESIGARLKGTGLTSIFVMKSKAERAPLMRFDTDKLSNFMGWDMTPAGFGFRMVKGTLQPSFEAKVGGVKGRLAVVSFVWEGSKVEQRLHVTLPGGHRAMIGAGDAPFKEQVLHRYTLGGGSGDPKDAIPETWVAEWLIYDRALNAGELEKVERQLAGKYLSAAEALTIDLVTPQSNGAILPVKTPPANQIKGVRPPAPPAADKLAVHYSAAAGTLGHDLLLPATKGQRVMAWANLAPGANPDHLLAYENGKEAKTPQLVEVNPEQFPGLKGPTPVLRFNPGETLEARGGGDVQGKIDDREFTCYLVACADSSVGSLLRLRTPTAIPALDIRHRPGGFDGLVAGTTAGTGAMAAAEQGKFCLVGFTWRGTEKAHRLWVVDAAGNRTEPVSTSHASDILNIDGYRIGVADGAFAGWVAEVLIYTKALDDATERQVEDYLRRRYFTVP
jgi:hypothetical protein